jgi:hypothetical protein
MDDSGGGAPDRCASATVLDRPYQSMRSSAAATTLDVSMPWWR